MFKKHNYPILADWLYIILISFLFIIYKGYTAYSGDHEEHLPQVFKLLDPSLYTTDFFVNHYLKESFTVRFYYIQLTRFLFSFSNPQWTLFILTFSCILCSVYSFFRLSECLTGDKNTSYIAPLFIFFIFYDFTIGGNNIQYTIFISSTIAKAIASFALLKYFSGKKNTSFFLLGVASLFQLLVGLQLSIVLLLAELITDRNLKKISAHIIYFLISAVWILGPIFYQLFLHVDTSNKRLFYHVLFNIRAPQHYNPTYFPMLSVIGYIVFLLIGIFMILKIRKSSYQTIIYILIIISILQFVHFLCSFFGIGNIYILFQWFKLTIWSTMFVCIVLSGWIAKQLPSYIFKLTNTYFFSIISFMGILLASFIIFNSEAMPIEKLQHRYRIARYPHSDLEKMYEWIKINTPKESLIMTFPNENSLLCQAQRSKPLHFRAIIHRSEYMNEWINQADALYNAHIENNNYKDSSLSRFIENLYYTDPLIPYKIKVDYKLVEMSKCKYSIDTSSIVFISGDYALLSQKSIQ